MSNYKIFVIVDTRCVMWCPRCFFSKRCMCILKDFLLCVTDYKKFLKLVFFYFVQTVRNVKMKFKFCTVIFFCIPY